MVMPSDSKPKSGNITSLLTKVNAGHPGAEEALFGQVYTELHRMASAAWRNVPPSDTLQPTALVHEMYVRLFRDRELSWDSRRHFFMAAARAMHDILVEQARRHGALKRGGHLKRRSLTGAEPSELALQADEVLALDEAVTALSREHPDAARVLTLRTFGGLTHEEIADLIGMSKVTVRRRWAFAKAWVKSFLNSENR